MDKNLLVLLLGDEAGNPVDLYQVLQQKEALSAARAAGFGVKVACARSFDQFTALRRHLAESPFPVDAVLAEPWNASTMKLMLNELKGRTGLVLLNAWDALVESHRADWGAALPLGSVSLPHAEIGKLQGSQVSALVPADGAVLVVTGPARSSAAQERLEGLRSTLRSDITVHDTEASQWAEAAGIAAFNDWYRVFKSRHEEIHVIAGQSDDIAVGARAAACAVPNPEHAAMFSKAKLLGVGGCPGFGRDLVDDGDLHATITVPANTGMAIGLLKRFWADGTPLPPQSFSTVVAYPPSSAPGA